MANGQEKKPDQSVNEELDEHDCYGLPISSTTSTGPET